MSEQAMNCSRFCGFASTTRSATAVTGLCKRPEGAIRAFLTASRRLHTDYSHQRHDFSSRHPQIGQRKQRDDVRRVLGQALEANLRQPELTFYDPEGVLHLGPYAGLAMLVLARAVSAPTLGQAGHVAGPRGDVPVQISPGDSLLRTTVTGVSPDLLFLAVQQVGHLLDIRFIGRRGGDGVHQAAVWTGLVPALAQQFIAAGGREGMLGQRFFQLFGGKGPWGRQTINLKILEPHVS